MLSVKGLSTSINNKKILENINLDIEQGELHLLIGPNGAGKSTLLKGIMNLGEIEKEGKIILDSLDISDLETDQISKKGVFVSFQHPVEIPGVHLTEFLRNSYNLLHPEDRYDPWSFREYFDELADKVGFNSEFGDRDLNTGFSGGEKKRSEILQMLILKPKYALLDEVDSGLDVDSMKRIFSLINEIKKSKKTGILLISHNTNILQYLSPDKVHLLSGGRITATGGVDIVKRIIDKGYQQKQ